MSQSLGNRFTYKAKLISVYIRAACRYTYTIESNIEQPVPHWLAAQGDSLQCLPSRLE
jgi:hypothetical protein